LFPSTEGKAAASSPSRPTAARFNVLAPPDVVSRWRNLSGPTAASTGRSRDSSALWALTTS
jgi:hypothetical protein